MSSVKSFISFCFCFAHLIAGVNHDKVNSTLLGKLTFNAQLPYSLELNTADKPSTSDTDILGETSVNLTDENTSALLGPLCLPYDSCSDRCGNVPTGLPYACNCDSQCAFYADCCVDFEKQCGNVTKELERIEPHIDSSKFTCQLLFGSYSLFTVSKCSDQWENTSYASWCAARISNECVLSNVFSDLELSDTFSQCKSFVYSQCMKRFSLQCNESVEPRCATISKTECGRISSVKCRRCEAPFWPVVDSNGTLYANSYCAVCNFQNNYTVLDFETLTEQIMSVNSTANNYPNPNVTFRSCFPLVVDYCPDYVNGDLYDLCKNTSGPVVPILKSNLQHRSLAYKNVYCALCNDENINELECAGQVLNNSRETNIMRGVEYKVMDFVTGITSDIQGLRLDDIPAAFSMLLNFGLDGRQRVYISSEEGEAMRQHQRLCGAGYIWDPFSKVCRRLHCSTEFVLVDYQCVKKEVQDDNNSTMNEKIDIPDASSDFVHLSFSAEMELLDFLQFHDQDIDEIKESIRESFASSFNIKIERIRNVNFNISLGVEGRNATFRVLQSIDDNYPINFTFSMDLYEMPSVNLTEQEPSVDNIVSMLASALSYNGFQIGINNKMSRIYQIHQSVDFLTSWCNSPNVGVRKEYWNSDFKVVLNENISSNLSERIKGIYVYKTDQFYAKGDFIADILYQGYQFNRNLINVSGVAIVCDWKVKLNSSCPRVILEKHEYSISQNGSLLILNSRLKNGVDDSVYERTSNETIMVCLSTEISNEFECYNIEMNVVQAYVSYVLSWISVVAMILVLATYTIFPCLRNLPGCNTMNLTFSLTAMQVNFIFGQRSVVTGTTCKVVACALHYEILCCFMWMNIIAYDLYKTFGNKTTLSNIRSKGKYLPRYMGYAYGVPLVMITTTTLLDHFLKDSTFSPHYGSNNVCWITSKCAAIIYFAGPLAIVTCINFGFYVLTIISISNVKHVLYLSSEKCNKKGKSDVFLYARMALVIGLTWALAFAAAYVKEEKLTGQILTYLFIIFNTLQGVFIFIVFVLNRRVCDLYREGLRKLLRKISSQAGNPSVGKSFRGFAHAIERSVSTNTIVSTISNASSCSNDSGLRPIKEEE